MKWTDIIFHTQYIAQTPSPVAPINSICQESADQLEIVFIIDVSCGLSEEECIMQQDGIADLIGTIKVDVDPRIAIVEFGGPNFFGLQVYHSTYIYLICINNLYHIYRYC